MVKTAGMFCHIGVTFLSDRLSAFHVDVSPPAVTYILLLLLQISSTRPRHVLRLSLLLSFCLLHLASCKASQTIIVQDLAGLVR